ncbi:MAG: carbohydrate ABC transporter permease [Actinobacteria bacterium]|nr:carbohydrate ABC transporter permease [Actinomycetota bacterium]
MASSVLFTQKRSANFLRYSLITLLSLLFVFPLLYLVSGSLMSLEEVQVYPPRLIPSSLNWSNYIEAFSVMTPRIFFNTLFFTFGILILQLILSFTAGFALAKMPFKYAALIVALFAIPVFLPTNISIIPLYLVTYKLGLLNTWGGMILPIVGSTAFGTLLFRQFMVNFPEGLIDAARMDGASWPRVLFRIVLPLARPPIASYSAITFLTAWNMYIWPLMVGSREEFRVATVQLAPLIAGGTGFYGKVGPNVTYAAALLSALPVVLFFLWAQRWFINAIAGTGNDS